MSQQHECLPPPPPRSPAVHAATGASLPQQRRQPVSRHQPPAITTNLARTFAGQARTPASGATLGVPGPYSAYSPSTPVALNPRTSSALAPPGSQPASQATSPRSPAMEPYNPRQWSNRGQVSGTQMVFQQRASVIPRNTQNATGMEALMPSPPPPYSPEAPETGTHGVPVRASPLLEIVGFTASPLPAESSVHSSPQLPMSPSFPPPPGPASRFRERSASGQRGFFSLSGLRGKQPVQPEPWVSHTIYVPDIAEPRPPAARRAASTGQLQSVTTSAVAAVSPSPIPGTSGRASPENNWQPGMPLPGPPPGPPPPGARSQSLNRYPTSSASSGSMSSDRGVDVPFPRRAPTASNLGPIPPTPADWIDSPTIQRREQSQRPVPPSPHPQAEQSDQNYHALRIDTGATRDSSLTRRPAKRNSNSQGIRERRSRSRAAKEPSSDIMSPESNDSRPSDLVFNTDKGAISLRREHMRTVSGYAEPSAEPSSSSQGRNQPAAQPAPNATNNVLTPPYTPAIAKSNDDAPKKQVLKVPGSATSDRPISHLLHQPVDDAAIPAPLTPSRPPSSDSAKTSTKLDAFYLQAMDRHRTFVEKEAAAHSDEERLELFANFMVNESRLRRDRYPTAYNAMAGDIVDLTRDMWRSYTRQSKRAVTPSTSMSSFDPTVPSSASDGQPASAHGHQPSSASSIGDFTPATDTGSIGDLSEGIERSDSRQWGEQFKPSLSPIPSMNVSTVPDEDSSRGRTASRWWEKSNSGSGSIGKPDRIEKSHRETKYMGVTAASLQEVSQQTSPHSSRYTGSTPGASTQTFAYGPNEYPPEKTGWHEGVDFDTPMATPHYVQRDRQASTPGAYPLDVSRLVTLPPPYPRHHPAINNSHPLLSDLRSEHRILLDNTKIREIKDAYLDQDFAIQREQREAAKERKARLRNSISGKISDGTISFADAAKAEADFDAEEAERGKASARANFDVFEASVAHPLNTLLTERLQKANACINQLRAELESRNQISDPNQAQEEGDEQPERLEKLTLLKWLFESREQLHKEMFDLHADRSAKYSEVILTPYRIARMQGKIDEAAAFFTRDSQERQTTFAKDSLARFEELKQFVELNVSRGVEDQLSAFWDIAPGLLEVIQHLPANLEELEIHIPEQEFAENPAYHAHPLQYLYTLLNHAHKSAYQFIESQTNLLCLLHEVRTATTKTSLRLREVQRSAASAGDDRELRAEMLNARLLEEERLTEDLKEKVGEVEAQWREALGEGLEICEGRVRIWLEEGGGWEDGLEG